MTITPAFLDELRARLPLSDVVGRRVQWDSRKSNPARRDYWACCPFHEETTPSFHVDDRRGFYHCFGCGAHGDVVRFLMETEKLTFPEAVERLAGEAGMEPPRRSPGAKEKADQRAELVRAHHLAVRHFQQELRRGGGRDAMRYLRERRNLTPETIDRFALGYAPRDRNGLLRFLADHDIGAAQAVEAGLAIAPDDGGAPFDRFRDRIMFPIRDAQDRCVAFGGRAMRADAKAKYLNSPETPIFSKGALLYNWAMARDAFLKARDGRDPLIVVEGYMDVIALAQAGFQTAVAPMGTALTDRQLDILWRVAETVILCFDGDRAGARAAERALDMASSKIGPRRTLRFAFLPQGRDPDDLVKEAGIDAFRAAATEAAGVVDVMWRRIAAAAALETPEGRAALRAAVRQAVDPLSAELREEFRVELSARADAAIAAARPARPQPGDGRGSFRRDLGPSGPSAALLARSTDRSKAGARRRRALVIGAVRHPWLLDDHLEAFAALELHDGALDMIREALLERVQGPLAENLESALGAVLGAEMADLSADASLEKWPFARADADRETVLDSWREAFHIEQSDAESRRRRDEVAAANTPGG